MPELEHLGPEDGRSPLNGYHSPKRVSPMVQSEKQKIDGPMEYLADKSPVSPAKESDNRDDEMRSEEEKIREYMRRSDTAVIFAEPVDKPPSNHLNEPEKTSDTQPSSNNFALKCRHCDNHVFTGINALSLLQDHLKKSHRESASGNDEDNNQNPKNCRFDEEQQEANPTLNSPVIIPANDGASGPYRCDKCSSSFPNIDNLEKHLLLHSPTTQSCRVCHKTFANVYRLQRHMISHDESAVLRKFKCPECEKAFKFKHHLKEHIRIHSGEKPFECPNCGKRFSHSGSYSSHMTSKKCLVVNLKVRRSVDRSVRAKKNNQNNNNNILRPIIPKYGDEHHPEHFMNSTSITSSTNITSPVTVSSYLGQGDRFPPPAAAMLTNSYSQPSMQPFLPNPSFSSMGLHPLLASHFQNSGVSANPYLPSSIASSLAAMAATLPDLHQSIRKSEEKNENIRRECKDLEDPKGDEKDEKDLKAVKKILEIVDATAKQQSIKSEREDVKTIKCESDAEVSPDGANCQFCGHCFDSRIALHQHERYLCPENKDLLICMKSEIKSEDMEDCKPGSSIGTGDSDDDSAKDNNDDDNSNTDEGRKWRVRSLFSEEHLHVLKSFYKMNPRPKKYDVERLANQIGFATRVVQVWFQNMRARDRRRGRHLQIPYFPSNSPKSFPSNQTAYPSLVSPYNGVSSPNSIGAYYSQHSPPIFGNKPASLPPDDRNFNGHCSSPSSSPTALPSRNITSSSGIIQENVVDDQPLDLSMKTTKENGEENALNLSRKSSRNSTPSRDSNNGVGEIPSPYKGLDKDGGLSPASQFLSNLKSRSLLANHDAPDLRYLHRYPQTTFSSLQHILSIPPLHPLTDHANLPTSSYNQSNNHAKILPRRVDNLNSPNSYSHSEYNSDDALVIDDGSAKPASKRPWPHVNGEDLLEDPLDGVKQTKPWKQHKLLEGFALEDGMYSCDQCDKVFSKQSSLARHKYEHSGQRPHKCEQCGKAFKHKHHLTEHRRLHSGEKPFQCKKCLKRFSHSGSYSQHMNHRYSYCKPYRE